MIGVISVNGSPRADVLPDGRLETWGIDSKTPLGRCFVHLSAFPSTARFSRPCRPSPSDGLGQRRHAVMVIAPMFLLLTPACGSQSTQAPRNAAPLAKNSRIKAITALQVSGARPRFSPAGTEVVFDRANVDGFYDVYRSDLSGRIIASLTDGHPGINQRHNGNAIFHPSGKFIIFISEESDHVRLEDKDLGDPGVGLYSNFWATDLEGRSFWKLTNIPIKKAVDDGIPSMAAVNPVFSADGSLFLWSERYAEGGRFNWGRWRIMATDFVITGGTPSLENERVVAYAAKGNYVTAMALLDARRLLLAGNLDGQHEYGMDQYIEDVDTHELANLTNTPLVWEEDSCVAPNGQIIYMSNIDAKDALDFSNPDWHQQPREREYYLMNQDGSGRERLTYFNDPSAPEYVGKRVVTAACSVSADGRYLAGTQGIDQRSDRVAQIDLRPVLIEFAAPLRATAQISPLDITAAESGGR